MELAGYRSLMTKTARALPFATEPASYKEAMENLDERWGDPAYWQVIRRNTSDVTPYYLLAAVDHRIDDLGELAPATPDQAIYLDIFARTFWMGLVITAICLVLARSEEHTSELQSLMRISYAVFCLKKQKT